MQAERNYNDDSGKATPSTKQHKNEKITFLLLSQLNSVFLCWRTVSVSLFMWLMRELN